MPLAALGVMILKVSISGLGHGYIGRFGMEATPDQHGVIRFPSRGKSGLFTPVEAMVIQCLESHFLAGKAMGPSVEPAATRTRSPHSAALMSACTSTVVEWG